MITARRSAADEILPLIGGLATAFGGISPQVFGRICEIRLRTGRQIALEMGAERRFLDFKPTAAEMQECIRRFCRCSVHSYARELSEGYITLRGGHRAGFCGTASVKNGVIESVRDISGINIRVAREHIGSADLLYNTLFRGNSVRGLLIAGKPLSAKTTVLRDLIRQLGEHSKVAVIDERCELAAAYEGIAQNNIGANTDVLSGFTKTEGITRALRVLSPEFIAFDESGGEYRELLECANCGVRLIFTAHCGDIAHLPRGITELMKCGAISHIALLGSGAEIGRVKGIWRTEVDNASCGDGGCGRGGGDGYRLVPLLTAAEKGTDAAQNSA